MKEGYEKYCRFYGCEEKECWYNGCQCEGERLEKEPKRKIDSCKYFNEEIGCNQIDCKCEKEEANFNMKKEILAEMERLEKEPKQETIEEINYNMKQERSYSEDEVIEILNQFCDNFYENSIREDIIIKWFQQFKKTL